MFATSVRPLLPGGGEGSSLSVIPAFTQGDVEDGSTTVEYAIGAVATAAFAGLLLAVLKSGGVKGMIQALIESALSL